MATRSTIKSRREEIRGRSKRTQRFEKQTDIAQSIGKALKGFKEGIESGGGGAGILKRIGKLAKGGKAAKGIKKTKAERADDARAETARRAKIRKETGVSFATKETLSKIKAAQKTLRTTTDRKAKKRALTVLRQNLGSKRAAELGQKSVGRKGAVGKAGGKFADKTPGQERLKRAFAPRTGKARIRRRPPSTKQAAEQTRRKRIARDKKGLGIGQKPRKMTTAERRESQKRLAAEDRRRLGITLKPKNGRLSASEKKSAAKSAQAIRDRLGELERGIVTKTRKKGSRKAVKDLAKIIGTKRAAKFTKKQVDKVFSRRGKSLTQRNIELKKAVAFSKTKAGKEADVRESAANALKRQQIFSRKQAKEGKLPSLLEKSINRPKGGFKPRGKAKAKKRLTDKQVRDIVTGDARLQRKLDVLKAAGRKGPVSKRKGLPFKVDGKKLTGKIKVPRKRKDMTPAAIKKRVKAGEVISRREEAIFDRAFPNKAEIAARKRRLAFQKKTPEQRRKILNKQARDRRADRQGPGSGEITFGPAPKPKPRRPLVLAKTLEKQKKAARKQKKKIQAERIGKIKKQASKPSRRKAAAKLKKRDAELTRSSRRFTNRGKIGAKIQPVKIPRITDKLLRESGLDPRKLKGGGTARTGRTTKGRRGKQRGPRFE